MIAGVENIFAQGFKDNIYRWIDIARGVFDEKVDREWGDWVKGHRFNDDSRVLNECLSFFVEKGVPLYFFHGEQNQKIIDFMVRILFECGKTDHYYKYEKDWF